MKLSIYSLSLFSLAALLPLISGSTSPANACAIVDATTKVAIHGSDTPANQQSNLNTGFGNNCLGNSAVGTTTQVGVGTTPPQQTSQSNYYVDGGQINNTGLTSPNIKVTPQTRINIKSPAYDPQFLNGVYPR